MLSGCVYQGRELAFSVGNSEQSSANKFTVIVGKNGTGKSRLLQALVTTFIKVSDQEYRRSLDNARVPRPEIDVSYECPPSCVIALSTSPFDRFPTKSRGYLETDAYQYLGLRGLGSQNLSLSFVSRIFGALLEAVGSDLSHAKTIKTVLDYLGYDGFIEARFVCSMHRTALARIFDSEERLSDVLNEPRAAPEDRFFSNLRNLSHDQLEKALHILHKWHTTRAKPRLDLRVDARGIYDVLAAEEFDLDWAFLLKIGFFQLRDLGLSKKGSNSLIRINDASSGEQCVVMALLGIASHIRDGALICIDEPEICLHPEWQERYIQLLMTTFSQFHGCHFIIATHSPQIIAHLQGENCYVLDLENGTTQQASEINGRSADFQLAKVFRVPGERNEYLSRVFFNALRTLGSGEALSPESLKELYSLLSLKTGLNDEDPVKGLMDIFEKTIAEALTHD